MGPHGQTQHPGQGLPAPRGCQRRAGAPTLHHQPWHLPAIPACGGSCTSRGWQGGMGWDSAAEVFPSSSPGPAVASQPLDSHPGLQGSCSHQMKRLTALAGREGVAAVTPVPMAEARDKQATGPELLRDRIKRPGGARQEPGEGCGGKMANPAWGSHRDFCCLQQQSPNSWVGKSQTQCHGSTLAPTDLQLQPGHIKPPRASCCLAREPTRPPSCREQVGEREHPPSASAQPRQAQPHPRSSPMHQQTDSLTRTPGWRVWHHGPAWATLIHGMGGSCPPGCLGHNTPWREPRAIRCRARRVLPELVGLPGNRSGRSRRLHQDNPKPAAPRARSPRRHGQTRNPPPGETQPSLGTWVAQAPTPGAPSPELPRRTPHPGGEHRSRGTPCQSQEAQSAEVASPCPKLGRVSIPPQAGAPWPGRGHSCPHGTLGHSTGVGGFGGTHMYRDRGGVGGVGSRNRKRGPQGDSGTPVTEAGRCCGTP